MTAGRITGSNVRLRAAPNGAILGQLALGTRIEIGETTGGWVAVTAGGQSGFVSAQFVAPDAAPAGDALPPEDNGTIDADARNAFTPDGRPFARRTGPGFATVGATTIADFLASDRAQSEFAGTAASLLHVIAAASRNEGRLEAINSYDNSFLSFGALQWTAGQDGNAGELAALLARLQQRAPAAFDSYFGRYGLDLVGAGGLRSGFLSLAGQTLNSAERKSVLRSALWAYRFWRAGHDPTVRACQIAHALARIDLFRGATAGAGPVSAYVTSEYGVALLLDEHVNRPGHVPGTLAGAIQTFIGAGGKPDPSNWTDADEAELLALYIERRNATNMTDSAKRATNVAAALAAGTLSASRGSFRT